MQGPVGRAWRRKHGQLPSIGRIRLGARSGAGIGRTYRDNGRKTFARPMLIPVPRDVRSNVVKAPPARWDDLSRSAYCVLGLPIDAIDMPELLRVIDRVIVDKIPFLLSTPNLNFLVRSRTDFAFSETVLLSELCPPDGMPVVWLARLLGLPIKSRVAGSDLLETLRARPPHQQLRLFLFGGPEGVAETAAAALNRSASGLHCAGFAYPGFGSVEDMSGATTIAKINASRADFLVVALGAEKGQSWLVHNHDRLTVPLRSHLGASINFAAGRLRRAPNVLCKLGLEWIWRIKEEPHLWKRYWRDGCKFLGLIVTTVLPLVALERWAHLYERIYPTLLVGEVADDDTFSLAISGTATRRNIEVARARFRELSATKRTIRINLANTRIIDARFLGLLLMLNKQAKKQNAKLSFIGASFWLRAIFRLNGAGFLLDRSE